MNRTNFVILTFSSLMTMSCVSKKNHQMALDHIDRLERDSTALSGENSRLGENLVSLSDSFANYKQEQNNLTSSLLAQLDQKSDALKEKEGTLAERAERLRELQQQVYEQNERMRQLRRTMRDALINVPAKDLELEMRDGKLYINLSENLLFASGSAIVDKRGKDALKSVSDVLANSPDLQIEIIGHTDSVPIRTARFSDNWDLSAARATAITRILVDEYRVDGERIRATGRSEYRPISSNDTPEGRAKNRRTEIVISPKLDILYPLLEE